MLLWVAVNKFEPPEVVIATPFIEIVELEIEFDCLMEYVYTLQEPVFEDRTKTVLKSIEVVPLSF